MTDYRRMVWQYKANRIAEVLRLCCFWVLFPPEIMWGVWYTFPKWNRVALIGTGIVWFAATFIDRYTRMYRAVD